MAIWYSRALNKAQVQGSCWSKPSHASFTSLSYLKQHGSHGRSGCFMARPDDPVSFLASQKGVNFAAGIGGSNEGSGLGRLRFK